MSVKIARRNGKSGAALLKELGIVRCRDCENWSDQFQLLSEDRTVKRQFCTALERMTCPDFFCAFGEREK